MYKKVQGYLLMVPNEPDGRGMYYFTLKGAIESRDKWNEHVNNCWPDKGIFNMQYWKEKPLPSEIYEVVLGDRVDE